VRGQSRGPYKRRRLFRTGALRLSVSVTLGSPVLGWIPAPLHPDVPYEDVTSTEPNRLLSNGSPPFRGLAAVEGPNPPDSVGRPSLGNRARMVPRERTRATLKNGRGGVNGQFVVVKKLLGIGRSGD